MSWMKKNTPLSPSYSNSKEMDCYLTYILPGFKLTISNAHTIFLKENDAPTTSTDFPSQSVIVSHPKQHDTHIRAYRCWRRKESNRLRYEAWCREELALREQEEAWAITQQQKRARLEAEIKGRKANTCITIAKPTSQIAIPTTASQKPHVVKTTIFQQITVDKEELCEGPACRGQEQATWILTTQEYDKEDKEFVKIKFFVCNTCNEDRKSVV